MRFISIIYYVFIFSSLVWSSFFLQIFFKTKSIMWKEAPAKHPSKLSIIVPCYNGAKKLPGTIENLMKTTYPLNKLEILIVNDGSQDNTIQVARMLAKQYKQVRAIDKPHGGKAHSINYALKLAKGKHIVIVDDDSYPMPNALLLLNGYFEREEGVGAVTSNIRVREKGTFFQKIQDVEYTTIVWVRKLLQHIDSIYVTPGPLSMYSKKALLDVGGFDEKNMTEDIEIAWRLLKYKYKVRVSLAAKVLTNAPRRLKAWWRQRVRWSQGGTQTLWKYSAGLFSKGFGTLGMFVIPFFVLSYIISITGFSIVLYRIFAEFTYKAYYTVITGQSSAAQSAINVFALPNSFTFFGIILFTIAIFYLSFALITMGNTQYFTFRRGKFLVLIVYSLLYVTVMPIILLTGIIRNIRGVYKW